MRKLSKSDTWVLVVLLVVGGLSLALFSSRSEQGSPAPRSQTTVTTASTSSTGTTVNKQQTAQIRAFVQAYYLLKPGDSAKTRRQRLASLKPPPSDALLSDPRLYGSPPEMTHDRLTRRGQVKVSSITVQPTGSPEQRLIIAQVTTQMIYADGKVRETTTFPVELAWNKQPGGWIIVRLFEKGQEE